MVPERVFYVVAHGENYNRGARLVKDGWTYDLYDLYDLGCGSHKVHCVKSRVVTKENKNTYTNSQGVITEYADCKLSDIPDSVESDWVTWDEY